MYTAQTEVYNKHKSYSLRGLLTRQFLPTLVTFRNKVDYFHVNSLVLLVFGRNENFLKKNAITRQRHYLTINATQNYS